MSRPSREEAEEEATSKAWESGTRRLVKRFVSNLDQKALAKIEEQIKAQRKHPTRESLLDACTR